MSEQTLVVAGRCTTRYQTPDQDQEHHGDVVVVAKPDGTVLVHDADGYQPTAWLTRAETVVHEPGRVLARDGQSQLVVDIEDRYARGDYPTTPAGVPLSNCPDCGDQLVRSGGQVTCAGCAASYGLPADAIVLEEPCPDCGLPRLDLQRGEELTVCLDRQCDPLVERVRARFDREWDCPACGSPLRVLRRGGLLLGCDAYPDCDTSYSFPRGLVDGACDCGLPVFETPTGRRCLDPDCGLP